MTSSSPSKLYIALIIFIGLIGGYIAYAQLIKPPEAVIAPSSSATQAGWNALKNLKIDFSTLDKALSNNFTTSGEAPVSPGVTGKKDIFAP